MSETLTGLTQAVTDGGIAAKHEPIVEPAALVGSSTASEHNTIRAAIIPVACWRVEDLRFEFDSSFVTPGIKTELDQLAQLVKDHPPSSKSNGKPGCPLSVFGQADPVGNDDYNKQLSGRRATAIYALLTRDINLWEKLFSQPFGNDKWGSKSLETMLDTISPAPVGKSNQEQAIQAEHNTGKRKELYQQYMDKLCGPDLKLQKQDFLGHGDDVGGKADFQGCSEFNPVLIFSQEDQKKFEQDKDKTARNGANAPNRRVMVLIFRKGSRVSPSRWPCPRVNEGVAGCKKRFWSDGEQRRSKRFPDKPRKFEDTKDTFACRFYHRLVEKSPCETILPRIPATFEIILDNDNNLAVDAVEPVAAFVRVGLWDHAFDPANGNLLNGSADAQNFISKDSVGKEARRFYFRVKDPNATGQAEVRVNWRTEFGAGGNDDAPASQVISLTPTSDPSVFVSHAVFLVADAIDQAQVTDSGLPSTNTDKGARSRNQSNHRIRKITVDDTHRLDTNVVAQYSSLRGGGTVNLKVPLFNRAPDERLKIKVHMVNVRGVAGGSGTLSAARKTTAIDALHSVYACTGIFLEVDELVIDPPVSCIGWATRFPTSPLAIGADPAVESPSFPGGNLVPSASQTDIINVIRARPDFNANDIYLVYVTKIFATPLPTPPGLLTLGSGGIAFTDSFTAAGSVARSFAFIGVQTVNQFADPHEMTHITTDLRNTAGGHFHLEANLNTGPGNIDGRNLMQRFALIANNNPSDSKRLWDEDFTNSNITPAKIPAQIAAIRASRFVRPL